MLFGIASAPAAAQFPARPAPQPVAILTVLSGEVLMRLAHGDFITAVDGTVLYVGTALRTGADARALITLFEGSTVELDPASDITIEDSTARGSSTFAHVLWRGLRVVMHLTTADSRFEPITPASTASVRGIDFETATANGLGALRTTLALSASAVWPSFTSPTSWQTVAPTQIATERANTTSVSTSSASRGDSIRKVLTQTLAPREPSSGRSRDSEDQNDRDEADKEKN